MNIKNGSESISAFTVTTPNLENEEEKLKVGKSGGGAKPVLLKRTHTPTIQKERN